MGIRVIEYTKRDLRALLEDELFWSTPRLPITKHRALSQVSNPRASEDDTLLITALSDDQLLAHLGVLPDLIQNEARQPVKFGWLTAWWADKEVQSGLAASMILSIAMKRYAYRVAASSPSTDAIRVYDATRKFRECATFEHSYFVMGLPLSFAAFSASSRWISSSINRVMIGRRLERRGFEVRVVDSLDEELASFINRTVAEDPLLRDASYWRWVLSFPWMSEATEDSSIQERYAFSLVSRSFRQIPIVVRRKGEIVAFLFATLRDGRLSVKYASFHISTVDDVSAALQVVISRTKPWLFVCADTNLNCALKKTRLFYLMKRTSVSSTYATKVLPLPVDGRLQYGNGDSIFI